MRNTRRDVLGLAAGGVAASLLPSSTRAQGARELVIITLGSAGVYFADRSGQTSLQPAPEVEAVDTTGAGDAFCGAFAAWFARGASPLEALRAGTAAGALAVGVAGAQPSLPNADQINSLLSRLPFAVRLS